MLELTNHIMVRELLKVYEPKEWGVASADEVALIKNKLCLDKMNITELRNMRDYVVMSWVIQDYSNREKGTNETVGKMTQDKMSAITYVIDTCIFDKGGEV